ncbi:hypothetical protein C8Q80DRAFT_161972 [Daedaleopsis nitida]|nr:hypothetical protein C8Q80DRAFT_161972 [Daedaleopsis nitida]
MGQTLSRPLGSISRTSSGRLKQHSATQRWLSFCARFPCAVELYRHKAASRTGHG